MPDDLEQVEQPTVNDVMEGLGEDLTAGYVPDPEDDKAGGTQETSPPEEPAGTPPEEPAAGSELNEDGTPKVPASAEQPVVAPDDRPPDTWRPEAQKLWATAPKEIREEVRKREADIAKFVTATKPRLEISDRFQGVMEPMIKLYQKAGHDPWEMLEGALQGQAVLAYGTPEQKVAMFKEVAKECGIDVAALAQEGPAAATTEIALLRQEIAQLRGQTTGVVSSLQAARAQELAVQVNAFADDPAHPHFDVVGPEMKRLLDTGAETTLEGAYETAVWANPVTRMKEIERIGKEQEAKKAREAQERAAAARKAAAVNVKSNGAGRAAPPVGSVDETLREALKEIQSRG